MHLRSISYQHKQACSLLGRCVSFGAMPQSRQIENVAYRTGRFEAHIWQEGKQIYLGGFDAEEQAALAYDLAALKFRGVDALTNYDKSTYEQEMLQFNEVIPAFQLLHVPCGDDAAGGWENSVTHGKGAFCA